MSSDHVQLKAAPRTALGSAASRRLRREGMVPGVLYKAGEDSVAFQLPHRELYRAVHGSHGKTAVFEISVADAAAVPAMLKDWQLNPMRAELLHVDFQEVDLKVAVQMSVPVVLVGTSAGVRAGGVLDQPVREITIEALPDAIPDAIEVDVTDLEVGDVRTFAQVTAPAGVLLIGEDDLVLASVTAPSDHTESASEDEATEPALVGEDDEE